MSRRISYTEFQSYLKACLDAVCDEHGVLVVTQDNARSAVLISEKEYATLLKALHQQQWKQGKAILGSVAERDCFGSNREIVDLELKLRAKEYAAWFGTSGILMSPRCGAAARPNGAASKSHR
jgi:prevent-host-death family protein